LNAPEQTPVAVLHEHGLTHHQTGPLTKADVTTVEAVVVLVDEHRENPDGSALSELPGMGQRRVGLVCAAVDRWRGAQ
jgi:hypothetical protein